MELVSGVQPHGYLILIYGISGIGKTTEAAFADDPVFIDCEGGLNVLAQSIKDKFGLDLVRTPNKIATQSEFIDALRFMAGTKHKTIVIDTVSGLESILCEEVVAAYNQTEAGRKNPVTSIAQIPYGQGGEILAARWSYIMKLLQKTQLECGKNIILVGHSTVQKVEDPTTESYDRFTIDVHKKSQSVVINNVDAAFFCRQRTFLRDKETAKGKKLASTDGGRVMYSQDKPAYLAKSRFNLPDEIEMGGNAFKLIGELMSPKKAGATVAPVKDQPMQAQL